MATPEQNTLLALQIGQLAFQPLAEERQRRNALQDMMRQEGLKREAFDREAGLRRELAGFQADREDARQTGRENLQKNQLDALQKKQDADLEAREARQLQADFAKFYPQYAAAAARAGQEVKQRTDYETTAEGLGQLQADFQAAQVGYEHKLQEGAADTMVADLDDMTSAVKAAQNRLAELSRPTADETKVARTRAVAALKAAIERGDLAATAKLRPDAIAKGLAALARGDEDVAAKLLGDEAIGAYRGAIEQTLLGLESTKARLAERQQTNQQLMQLQGAAGRVTSDLRKAAATNPFLASKLSERRSALQDLMAPAETKAAQRSFDKIFAKPGAAPPSQADEKEPASGGATASYQYPGTSVLGAVERLPSAERLAMAPANILAFPGRAIDTAGRAVTGGLRGLMTGNFSLPEKGLIEQAGEGIGALFAPQMDFSPLPPPAPLNQGYAPPLLPEDRRRALEQLRLLMQGGN